MSVAAVRCACGRTEMETRGSPIASVVCYCDTCQEGSRQIAARAGAPPVLGEDGGTAYVLYRKDRVACANGAEFLEGFKLDETSTTSRVVATCCNSAMYMRFDDAKHWVPVYRARFGTESPPAQWRICTKYKPADAEIPADVPASPTYPAGFMWTLLRSKLAMLLGR